MRPESPAWNSPASASTAARYRCRSLAQPVITYVASSREPSLAWIGEPLDFDAVLDDIAARVEQIIVANGSFRATRQMGLFVCR
jgi:hypothetical protein